MKQFFIFISTIVFSLPLLASNKDYSKVQLNFSMGYTTLNLPVGSYSDPGLTFSGGYFLHPKLSLNGHYFLTSSPTGASNLNGLGLQAKYYFYHTESSFELKNEETRVRSFDRFFAYSSLQFLDREVRTSRLNISYSGFGISVGAGYKLNFRNSVGFDILGAQLKNAAGSTERQEASFMNMSIYFAHLL
jgi:hypothetical protein